MGKCQGSMHRNKDCRNRSSECGCSGGNSGRNHGESADTSPSKSACVKESPFLCLLISGYNYGLQMSYYSKQDPSFLNNSSSTLNDSALE